MTTTMQELSRDTLPQEDQEEDKQNLNERVSVKKHDYLKQDPPIRGQNYACVSFVSPENVIRMRDVFEIGEFVKALGDDVTGLFSTIEENFGSDPKVAETLSLLRERHSYLTDGDEMQQQLHLFRSARAEDLHREFQEKHGFQTSIRGLKIRGVYDSIEEARAHSKEINGQDPNFNVFIAQMGCWCPWSPNPDDISNSEYAETELNTLVRNYNANTKKMHKKYEERKKNKVEAARRHAKKGVSVSVEDGTFSATIENGGEKEASGSGSSAPANSANIGSQVSHLAGELDKNVSTSSGQDNKRQQ